MADSWFIFFRYDNSIWYPALDIDDFTEEEVRLLIELLEGDICFETEGYAFKAMAHSELKPAALIRIGLQYRELERYFGEFDFGIYEFRFPDEWKKCVRVNDVAARYAEEICASRKETTGVDGSAAEPTLALEPVVPIATPPGAPTPGETTEVRHEFHVTLLQAASMVSRCKKTLERRKKDMPHPRVEGGGGKPDEWAWSELRPWLEKEFGRKLPHQFPADRSRAS
jgi:hypothetical protein